MTDAMISADTEERRRHLADADVVLGNGSGTFLCQIYIERQM